MARKDIADLSSEAVAGAEFHCRVTPRAASDAVKRVDGQLQVRVTAPPEDGKANAAVQALLGKALGVAKTRLTLVRGATSRDKVFRLDLD